VALRVIDAAKDFDVRADGRDETENLLDVATRAFRAVKGGDACEVQLPAGEVTTSDRIVIKGYADGSPRFVGAGGRSYNRQGTKLVYRGPAGGTALFLSGFNRGELRDFSIDQGDAKYAIHGSASDPDHPDQLVATSGVLGERLAILGTKPGCVGVALGTDPTLTNGATYEFSEDVWRDVMVRTQGGTAFKALSAGNCKNHSFEHPQVYGADVALDLAAGSGALNVWDINFGDCSIGIRCDGGQLTVSGGDCETNGKSFTLLKGGFPTGSAALLTGIEAWWNRTAAGASPEELVNYCGQLTLQNGTYGYLEGGAAKEFRLVHASLTPVKWGLGSLTSRKNWYYGCGTSSRPYLPIYDTSGNDLAPISGTYGGSMPFRLSSEDDSGGISDDVLELVPFNSRAMRIPHLLP
jgi:hypothetical protein